MSKQAPRLLTACALRQFGRVEAAVEWVGSILGQFKFEADIRTLAAQIDQIPVVVRAVTNSQANGVFEFFGRFERTQLESFFLILL